MSSEELVWWHVMVTGVERVIDAAVQRNRTGGAAYPSGSAFAGASGGPGGGSAGIVAG